MIVLRLACMIGFELPPSGVGSSTCLILPSVSTRYRGLSGPLSNRIGTMTSLSGIAADDGNFCTRLEVGLPVAVALGLALGVDDGLALPVGDCPAGGSLLPEIWNPTPTATPTSTRIPAMIETNLPRDPLPGGPCPAE